MTLYAMAAQVTMVGRWRRMVPMPTIFVDSEVQGIGSADEAAVLIKDALSLVVRPGSEVTATAVAVKAGPGDGPVLEAGDWVTLKADEREGWPEQGGVVEGWDEASGVVTVRLHPELRGADDDGLREVTMDQIKEKNR